MKCEMRKPNDEQRGAATMIRKEGSMNTRNGEGKLDKRCLAMKGMETNQNCI